MNEACLFYITLPGDQDAIALAEHLTEHGLCAGLNILGPGTSVYVWQGRIHKESEWVIFAQVAGDKVSAFEKEVLKLHPHVVPCVLGLMIQKGHEPFLNWIIDPTGADGK